MVKIGYHLALDLFAGVDKFSEQPRFFIPENNKFKDVSWKEYADKVKMIGGFLISTGIKVQDKISILGQNSFNWCVTHLGIQSVRGVMVPIYPASQPNLIEYFLDHSDSKILFCDSSFIKSIETIKTAQLEKIIVLDDVIPENTLSLEIFKFSDVLKIGQDNLEDVENKLKEVSDSDIATIIYTSGTTGLPKGVMLTHANLQSSSENWINLNQNYIPQSAVDLHWLPLSHTFGSGAIMLGNRLGWQSYMVNHKDLIKKIKEVKPNVFLSVPAYWEKMHNLIQSAEGATMKDKFEHITGGRLTFGLSGGAGLKKEIKESYHNIGLTIIEGYGLTECSPTLTMNRMDKFNFDTVGVPYPNVEVKLADDGEILAKGPNIFLGYFKDIESTKNAFDDDGWFKTGDVGRWTEDGFLQIIDRKKEILVTSGGKNIPPQNIERMFQDNNLINHFVVYGDGQKFLTALVTVNEDEAKKLLNKTDISLDSQELKDLVKTQVDEVNKKLASYESIKNFWICPKQLTVEDNLLTSSLKIRRKAIYEKYKEQFESLYNR